MDLVYECFVKLGLRYVCVTREGKYAGMVNLLPYPISPIHPSQSSANKEQTHKKTFVKYMRELEERDGHM